ncbi:sensor histidine kinase [Desulfofundulus thermocisternus]|uniref:sensor histidine kinase n=1 Tax=Desulfofundulus thermocisternus TaxID=42471 RepID=UPI00217D69A3|nr:PAS domain-containing protein [Desulfofundulus thermocisternus]
MRQKRNWLWIFWLIMFLLPLPLLLYTGYNLPRQLGRIDDQLERQVKYQEIALDIYHLTGAGQEYILYGDPQSLNDFRHYSMETAKKELELYNLVEQSRKQDVADLITTTRAYTSFMENEVMSRDLSRQDTSRELLLWQHRELSRQLTDRAASLAGEGWEHARTLLELTVNILQKESLLIFFLSLFSLGAVLYAGAAARPLAAWYSCLQDLVRDSSRAVVFVDRKEKVQYLNPAAEKLFNLSRETAVGKNLGDILILYPHWQKVVQPIYQALLQEEKTVDCPLSYSREGNRLLLTVDCAPVYLFGRTAGAVLTARQAPEPKDGTILLDTIERERKHLSIEIHDWIGRYLSSIIHGLDYVLRVHGEKLPEEVQNNLCLLRTQCQNAAIDMRSIMNDIHPYLIEKVGLIPALESYSANFERIHNRRVYIFYSQRSLRLGRDREIFIYRIIQEALTNVVRHSAATEVDIHFNETGDTLQIEILDNGGMREEEPVPGKGLWGMKERARFIGGDLVYGFMDGGFCVILTVPLTEGGKGSEEDRDHAGGGS